MPTKHPRINVTLESATAKLLSRIAKKEQRSVASLTRELIMEAIECREDIALSAIAELRDIEKAKKIKHEDVWK